MLNNQQIESNWPQIKSKVLSKWSKLSEDEVEKTHGSAGSLGKLVNTKYGSQEDFDTAYERICEACVSGAKKAPKVASTTTTETKKVNAAKPGASTDFEERSASMPSAEAGMPDKGTQFTSDDAFPSESLQRRSDAQYAKADEAPTTPPDVQPEFYPAQDPSPSHEDVKASNTPSFTNTRNKM